MLMLENRCKKIVVVLVKKRMVRGVTDRFEVKVAFFPVPVQRAVKINLLLEFVFVFEKVGIFSVNIGQTRFFFQNIFLFVVIRFVSEHSRVVED